MVALCLVATNSDSPAHSLDFPSTSEKDVLTRVPRLFCTERPPSFIWSYGWVNRRDVSFSAWTRHCSERAEHLVSYNCKVSHYCIWNCHSMALCWCRSWPNWPFWLCLGFAISRWVRGRGASTCAWKCQPGSYVLPLINAIDHGRENTLYHFRHCSFIIVISGSSVIGIHRPPTALGLQRYYDHLGN